MAEHPCPICGDRGGFHLPEAHHSPWERWGSPHRTFQEGEYLVHQWVQGEKILTSVRTKARA